MEDVNTELRHNLLEFNSRNNCQRLTNVEDGISARKLEAAQLNLLSSLIYPTQLTDHNKHRVSSFSATEVAYHLQKVSGKSDWKVNEHDFLGRSGGKFPGVTEHLKR